MKADVKVALEEELLQTILEGARRQYPRETVVLLRGRKGKNLIEITDLLIPPLANYGKGFANIPLHMLPTDFSIVGSAHSHPSGNLTPSSTDLNHFFGMVLMITGFPFANKENAVVYNRNGEKLTLQVTERGKT